MPYVNRSRATRCLTLLLVAYAPVCCAQADGCTAQVKVVPIGLQKPVDDTRAPHRNLTLARYRVDATANEKQCAVVSFNLRHSYKDTDGTVVTAAEPMSMRLVGGKGTERGEFPLRRSIPKLTWSAEDVSCKLCK